MLTKQKKATKQEKYTILKEYFDQGLLSSGEYVKLCMYVCVGLI